jgi:predicted aldo/keto reductase-like oxidoreductase
MMANRKVTRREFVRNGSAAAAAAGAVLAGSTSGKSSAVDDRRKPQGEVEKTLNHNPNMAYRKLGKCGLWISAVSFGGHWKNRQGGRYWATFDKDIVPDDAFENRKAAFTRGVELGINYLDLTTPAEALVYGKVMKECGVKMYVGYSDHILCMRNPKHRNVAALMREIDEGLRRLQVDCIDIFREQADMGGRHTDDEVKILVEAFLKAREQGKVKYLGMSSHSRPFLIHVIETFPEFTQVIFPFPFGATLDPKKSLFKVAAKNDVGISCIKPFNGGSLFRTANKPKEIQALSGDRLASLSLRTAVSIPEMTCILPGMTTPAEVENAARCATAPPLGDGDQKLIKTMGRQVAAALPRSYRWLREWETV